METDALESTRKFLEERVPLRYRREDKLSWLIHQGSCPGPGLEDGLGWTGVNYRGKTQ